jgi:hypothetical protein
MKGAFLAVATLTTVMSFKVGRDTRDVSRAPAAPGGAAASAAPRPAGPHPRLAAAARRARARARLAGGPVGGAVGGSVGGATARPPPSTRSSMPTASTATARGC